MEWFLGRHQMQGKPAIMEEVKKSEDESEDCEQSAYQRLAEIIMSKQVCQVSVKSSTFVLFNMFDVFRWSVES